MKLIQKTVPCTLGRHRAAPRGRGISQSEHNKDSISSALEVQAKGTNDEKTIENLKAARDMYNAVALVSTQRHVNRGRQVQCFHITHDKMASHSFEQWCHSFITSSAPSGIIRAANASSNAKCPSIPNNIPCTVCSQENKRPLNRMQNKSAKTYRKEVGKPGAAGANPSV